MSRKRKLGSVHWDEIHEKLNGVKRAVTDDACPASYSLCPSSVGGGCCPSTLSCGTSSCYATAEASTSPCPGTYSTCALDVGGGCCPLGYTCERNGCIAPTGTSFTSVCGANSYLCPSSLSYGCCRSGLSCGISTCYETTSTTTIPITLTITTTDSNSAVVTVTTVIETVYNPAAQTANAPSPTPTPVAKLPATTTSLTSISTSQSSPGINVKELGGIVGACVFLLLVLLTATYFILKRLNMTIKLTRDHGGNQKHHRHSKSGNNNLQHVGFDPLEQPPSSRTGSRSYQPRTNQTAPSELSNNVHINRPRNSRFILRSSRVSFGPLRWSSGVVSGAGRSQYHASSSSTRAYRSLPSSDTSRNYRTDSEVSQSVSVSNPTTTSGFAELYSDPPSDYFAIPVSDRTPPLNRESIDSTNWNQSSQHQRQGSGGQGYDIYQARGGKHNRQYSDVSELSTGNETVTSNESYELDDTSPRGTPHDKRNLFAYKSRVQDWVGMTGLRRNNNGGSSRRDDDVGSQPRSFPRIPPSPTPVPTSGSITNQTPSMTGDRDRDFTLRTPPQQNFRSFPPQFAMPLDAITEASRESASNTMSSNTMTASHTLSPTDSHHSRGLGLGGLSSSKNNSPIVAASESRAQIARMQEYKTDDTLDDSEEALTAYPYDGDVRGGVSVNDDGFKGFRDVEYKDYAI